jgi:hypothetical protein
MEASALIRPLGRLIEELRAAREALAKGAATEERAEQAAANGGGEDARRFADSALTLSRGMSQIETWGVVVRDLDSGICDFLAEREGRDVYLCWQLGEERIGFWHELEAGFAGRQPIDDAFGPAPPIRP